MIFKCKTCKQEQDNLYMFGKFFANNDGMEDDGEYCIKCFEIKKEKYGLTKNQCGYANLNKESVELQNNVVL